MTTTEQGDFKSTINDLIEICRDGEEGFKTAAENVKDPALRAEFMQYSDQRRNFASDLRGALESTGETPADHSTVAGTLHRGWMHIKQALASNDNKAVLAECERGEDYAVEAYEKAASASLPRPFKEMVESEYADVRRTHDRVRSLRDQWKAVD